MLKSYTNSSNNPLSSNYRYEIKFVLDNSSFANVMQWLYSNTTAFKFYENRMVHSIYFDDVDFSSVKENLTGLPERKKLRLRWYGNQIDSIVVFEVKTKNGRLGNKVSYPITSNSNIVELTFEKILENCTKDLAAQDIIIDKYIVPTLLVNYEREYYETQDKIRITIDHDIEFSDTQLHTTLNQNTLYSYPFKVMEIKFEPSMKDNVAQLIKPLNITPARHSKYLIGLSKLGYAVYI